MADSGRRNRKQIDYSRLHEEGFEGLVEDELSCTERVQFTHPEGDIQMNIETGGNTATIDSGMLMVSKMKTRKELGDSELKRDIGRLRQRKAELSKQVELDALAGEVEDLEIRARTRSLSVRGEASDRGAFASGTERVTLRDLKGASIKDGYNAVKYSSSSVFPPTLRQNGNCLEEIWSGVLKNRIYPPDLACALEEDKNCKGFIKCLKSFTKSGGYCLISRSLPTLCNFKNCKHPDTTGIVVDVFLVTESHPPTLLTFCTGVMKQNDSNDLLAYNKAVAKDMMFALYFTEDAFDIMYGVIIEKDIESDDSFVSRISEVREETSVYCISSNLVMSAKRCRSIYKAVITCSALTGVTPGRKTRSGSDCFYVLTTDMYRKLTSVVNCCQNENHTLSASDETYFSSLLAERLSRSGFTSYTNRCELKG